MRKAGLTALPTQSSQHSNPEEIRELVWSVVNGEQDYQRFVEFLRPITDQASDLENDTALALALMLGDVEKQGELNDKLHDLSENPGPPALALEKNGTILAANPAAVADYHLLDGDDVYKLGVSQEGFAEFCQRVYQHRGPSLLATHPSSPPSCSSQHKTDPAPAVLIGLNDEKHQVFWLHAIERQWPASINQAFKEVFSLSDAECKILSQLAQGMNSEQISEVRSRSIGTVRQQIKSLLSKLDASSQVQAAALASAISGQSALHYQHVAEGNDDRPALESGELSYDDRRIFWRRYGKAGGHPVLLLHGAYFGAGEYQRDWQWAYENHLDIVVIERLGYGQSQLPDNASDALTIQTEDCKALIAHLQWDSFYVLSHDFGFVPALAVASALPQHVKGVLAASPPAVYRDSDKLEHIPRYQRMFIWAARHAFWMTQILLRMAHVKARKYGPDRWMEMTFDGSPHDLAVYENAYHQRAAAAAYEFNLQQKSKGHEIDMQLSVATNWESLLAKVNTPILGLVGLRNDTFPADKVKELEALNPHIALREFDDAGMTLCVTHGETCFKILSDLIDCPSDS